MTPIILFGGVSSERRVSVASAQNVLSCVPEACVWFVDPTGRVFDGCTADLVNHVKPFEQDFLSRAAPTWMDVPSALDQAPSDAVFVLALHGGDGENGVLQKMLEDRKRMFTGSGSAASALAFDKALAKQRVSACGVKMARSRIVQGSIEEIKRTLLELFQGADRLVAKPVADGSSVGLYHIQPSSDVKSIAASIVRSGVAYLIEEYIRGTELTVGVIEEAGQLHALPPSEVRSDVGAAFDFAGKYLGQGSREITPAAISAELTAQAQALALAAHRALGACGYSRTDMIATQDGLVFLEINTLPGLTRASFIPQQLAASGRTMKDFLVQQLSLAQHRAYA